MAHFSGFNSLKLKGAIIVWGVFFSAGAVLAEEALSEDFLDYLLTFETDSGEWMDPEELDMMEQLTEDQKEDRQDEQ